MKYTHKRVELELHVEGDEIFDAWICKEKKKKYKQATTKQKSHFSQAENQFFIFLHTLFFLLLIKRESNEVESTRSELKEKKMSSTQAALCIEQ